jgi:hypothetical protein
MTQRMQSGLVDNFLLVALVMYLFKMPFNSSFKPLKILAHCQKIFETGVPTFNTKRSALHSSCLTNE